MTPPEWEGWYSHHRWRHHRRRPQLAKQPLCEWCFKRGFVVQAEIAHHAVPHHGDPHLFWNGALISLCKACHDGDAQRIERGGKPKPTIGIDGWPIE
jgi:hypothetical protein